MVAAAVDVQALEGAEARARRQRLPHGVLVQRQDVRLGGHHGPREPLLQATKSRIAQRSSCGTRLSGAGAPRVPVARDLRVWRSPAREDRSGRSRSGSCRAPPGTRARAAPRRASSPGSGSPRPTRAAPRRRPARLQASPDQAPHVVDHRADVRVDDVRAVVACARPRAAARRGRTGRRAGTRADRSRGCRPTRRRCSRRAAARSRLARRGARGTPTPASSPRPPAPPAPSRTRRRSTGSRGRAARSRKSCTCLTRSTTCRSASSVYGIGSRSCVFLPATPVQHRWSETQRAFIRSRSARSSCR